MGIGEVHEYSSSSLCQKCGATSPKKATFKQISSFHGAVQSETVLLKICVTECEW